YAWGQQQAEWTLSDMSHLAVTYPVVFMDVELPGVAPATDNGWPPVLTSPCSGQIKPSGISPAVDQSVLEGYAAYLTSHSSYKVGVYSSPAVWTQIFGTGSSSVVTDCCEWTYTGFTSSLSTAPDGWCLTGTSPCAQFFGGMTQSSPY